MKKNFKKKIDYLIQVDTADIDGYQPIRMANILTDKKYANFSIDLHINTVYTGQYSWYRTKLKILISSGPVLTNFTLKNYIKIHLSNIFHEFDQDYVFNQHHLANIRLVSVKNKMYS